jgi:hypothetical protein
VIHAILSLRGQSPSVEAVQQVATATGGGEDSSGENASSSLAYVNSLANREKAHGAVVSDLVAHDQARGLPGGTPRSCPCRAAVTSGVMLCSTCIAAAAAADIVAHIRQSLGVCHARTISKQHTAPLPTLLHQPRLFSVCIAALFSHPAPLSAVFVVALSSHPARLSAVFLTAL